eukprot:9480596-Pyramimonas_sp.AAC.1
MPAQLTLGDWCAGPRGGARPHARGPPPPTTVRGDTVVRARAKAKPPVVGRNTLTISTMSPILVMVRAGRRRFARTVREWALTKRDGDQDRYPRHTSVVES